MLCDEAMDELVATRAAAAASKVKSLAIEPTLVLLNEVNGISVSKTWFGLQMPWLYRFPPYLLRQRQF